MFLPENDNIECKSRRRKRIRQRIKIELSLPRKRRPQLQFKEVLLVIVVNWERRLTLSTRKISSPLTSTSRSQVIAATRSRITTNRL